MDEKKTISERTIAELIRASKEMPSGTFKTGYIDEAVIKDNTGNIKFRAKFIPDASPVKPLENLNSALKGNIYLDSFRKDNYSKFKIKKDFFQKLQREFNLWVSNLKDYRRKLFYDARGRVYFLDLNNNIYYLSRDGLYALNERGECFKINVHEDNFTLEYLPNPPIDYFPFKYITEEAFNKDEETIQEINKTGSLEDYLDEEIYEERKKDNITYIEEYRKNKENDGPKR